VPDFRRHAHWRPALPPRGGRCHARHTSITTEIASSSGCARDGGHDLIFDDLEPASVDWRASKSEAAPRTSGPATSVLATASYEEVQCVLGKCKPVRTEQCTTFPIQSNKASPRPSAGLTRMSAVRTSSAAAGTVQADGRCRAQPNPIALQSVRTARWKIRPTPSGSGTKRQQKRRSEQS